MASLDEMRRQLREFLGDMEALKSFADPGNREAAPFVAAFAAARVRALAAAKAYADAVSKDGGTV